MTEARARGRRVVVTGMGAITPVGHTVGESWEALLKGTSGLGRVTLFDPSPFSSQISCEVKDFDPGKRLDRKETKRTDRYAQFALWAADEAWKDSGLDVAKEDVWRIGVIVGSGIGGFFTLEDQHTTLVQKGPGRVSPFVIPMLIANMAAGLVSIRLGVKGPNMAIVTACASGAHSIGESFRIVERGDAEVMVAGGAESTVTPFGYAGFCNMGALSTRNDAGAAASCPFDARRDGFVMGEGGGILILEALEHAQARGAKIHAELIGYGASGDAHHMTAPDPDGAGAANAMARALDDAGVTPEGLDYINAHGTSTQLNDKGETLAIKKVLGSRAKAVPISSTKSMTGHMLGAAGAVEAVATVRALETGWVPPTANYEVPDPECDLDYVPNKSREVKPKVAMSNSFGFGGHNAVLVFRRWPN